MITPIDKLIIEFDKVLHTLAGTPTSARATPGNTLPEAQLSDAEKRHAASLMVWWGVRNGRRVSSGSSGGSRPIAL